MLKIVTRAVHEVQADLAVVLGLDRLLLLLRGVIETAGDFVFGRDLLDLPLVVSPRLHHLNLV